jgi:hypothetical protein
VGIIYLREQLSVQNTLLDITGHDLDAVARNLCDELSSRGLATPDDCRNIFRVLHLHAGSKRRSISGGVFPRVLMV